MQEKIKLYTIYKITNKSNNMIYIGQHIEKPYESLYAYMGSSQRLSRSIKKHFLENYTKEILFRFDNKSDMDLKEKELVNKEFVSRDDTYNLTEGGDGGFSHINECPINRAYMQMKATEGRIKKYGHPMGKAVDKESRYRTLSTRYFSNLNKYEELNKFSSLYSPEGNFIYKGTNYDISFILFGRRNAIKYRGTVFTASTHCKPMKNGNWIGYIIKNELQESSTTSATHVEDECLRNRICELKTHKDIVYSYKKL